MKSASLSVHHFALITQTLYARCHDKGVGEDDCVLKKDCAACKGFTPE